MLKRKRQGVISTGPHPLRYIDILMYLNRQLPLRIFFNVFNDQRGHFFRLVPFRRQIQFAGGRYLGGMFFGPGEISFIKYDHFQLMGQGEYLRQGEFEFLGDRQIQSQLPLRGEEPEVSILV